MSLRLKYREIVSKLMTPGAIGMAVLLGSVAPGAASPEPAGQQPSSAQGERVSERLAAIREAVSAVSGDSAQTTQAVGERRLAWGNWGWGGGWGRPWGGYGYGYSPWNNWHNWNNWRNGWPNW